MREGRIQTREIGRATGYLYPMDTTLLSATTEGAAQTLVVIRDDSIGRVERLFVGNQTGSAAALTVYAVPTGGSIGPANREITQMSIPPNTSVNLTDVISGLYAQGTEIRAFASTSNALILGGYVKGEF